MTRPAPVRMHVLGVSCRHCGAEIQLKVPDGDQKDFGAKLLEVAAMAERAHQCPKGDKTT